MTDIAIAFAGSEPIQLGAHRRPQRIDGTSGGLAQQRFQLRKDLLDRVEIGTVRWQIASLGTPRFDRFSHAGDLMRAQVIHDDDVADAQRRGERLFHPGAKGGSIDGSIENQRGDQPLRTKGTKEGGRLPVAVGNMARATLAARRAAPRRAHVGAGPGFIKKDPPLRIEMWQFSRLGMS
ncbi:hypothetical protein VRRI112168_15200 [Vreelandella rituensis]